MAVKTTKGSGIRITGNARLVSVSCSCCFSALLPVPAYALTGLILCC